MRKKPMLRLCALLLAAVFALGAAPAGASYAPSFSDVPAGEWYADYVSLCAGYGIINGYEDGTFRPQAEITRAEFMKLLCTIGELVPYKAIDTSIHWAAPNWDLLNDNGVLWGLDIPCTREALNTAINAGHEKKATQVPSSVYLMKEITVPGVLVECGFLSNAAETDQLKDPAYQTKLAAAIAAGVLTIRN